MPIQVYHDGTPSASLVVWIVLFPTRPYDVSSFLVGTAECAFNYALTKSFRLSLPAAFSANSLAHTSVTMPTTVLLRTSVAVTPRTLVPPRLRRQSVVLDHASQLVPVNLLRLDGSPALTGHYIVDIISVHDDLNPSERFVYLGRYSIPLMGYDDLKPGDILGTTSLPFLRIPLEGLHPNRASDGAAPVAESPRPQRRRDLISLPPPPSTMPNAPDEPPPPLERLCSPHDDQRKSFLCL